MKCFHLFIGMVFVYIIVYTYVPTLFALQIRCQTAFHLLSYTISMTVIWI